MRHDTEEAGGPDGPRVGVSRPPLPGPSRERTTWFALVLLMGLATLALLGHRGALRAHVHDDALAHAWVAEHGPVERTQLVLLVLCVVNGALLAASGRRLGWVLLPAALVVAVREADGLLGAWLGRNAHRPVMGVLVVLTAWALWRQRHALRASAALLGGTFGGLLAGAILVLIAAQVLGHPQEWTHLAREGSAARVAKRYVEEGLEGLAYLLALGATLLLWRTPVERHAPLRVA